jgi:hypothetical protein
VRDTLKFCGVALCSIFLLSGCIIVPKNDSTRHNKCEISSDRKTLKVIDLAKETNSYYSISGLFLFPVTGIISGTFVAVNNIYHLGEETIVCE